MTAISQRPYTYSPVNNPLVYKFSVTGGPFTLYRIQIGVYKASDNTLIGSLGKSPDLSGNVLADVSSILANILYRDWDDATLDENNIGAIKFYIKWQEFYTGSATSPNDDVANPRTAVLSSLQIGNNADLTNYVTGGSARKVLTMFDVMSMWRGFPFSISLINDQAGYYSRIREYDESNTLLFETGKLITQSNLVRTFLDEPQDGTKKILFDVVSGAIVVLNSSAWTEPAAVSGDQNFDSKVGNLFVAGTLAPFVEHSAEQVAVVPAGVQPSLEATVTINVAASCQVTVQFFFYKSGIGVVSVVTKVYPALTVGTIVETLNFPALSDVSDTFGIIALQSAGPSTLNSVTINLPAGQVMAFASPVLRSETKTILVKEPCNNPVYIFWKNSLGGDAFWCFDYSQDKVWQTDSDRKAKQLTMFADEGITDDEFDAINEVNTPGVVYKPAIPELTTAINKTAKRTDQQVYVIDEEGNKTGVINLTAANETKTRQISHALSVTIEYPELFL